MLAFSGMIHQTFVTGKPLFASINEIFAAPADVAPGSFL